MRTWLTVVVFALIVAVVPLVPAGANTSGTMYVSTDTTLTEDHDGPIVIVADNVMLDCAGHTVTGPGRLAGAMGVHLGSRFGVTVKNCVLADFNSGFLLQQSDNNTFVDNHVSRVRQGFTIQDSDGNRLEGNSVYDANDWFGYGFVEGSSDNVVTGNSASGTSPVGFVVTQGATGNTFTNNDSSNNLGEGFAVHDDPGTSGNLFSGNSAHNNKGPGFIDSTTGGTGDFGTDSFYSENVCIRNGNWPFPAGVCDPAGSFTDDDGNTFEVDIEWMKWSGITLGCNPEGTLYCPFDSVTRAQMASFLVRALDLPAVSGNRFSDVSGTHAANINALAEAGITLGCNSEGTLFCPDDYVTRAQMGSFLARALDLAPIPGDRFADVSGPHEPNINAIAEAGVTLGCNPAGTLYCPAEFVTRGQMAAFLHRALG